MDWGMSNARLELLICDQPVVVYKKTADGGKKHTKAELNDVMAKWEAKRKEQGKDAGFGGGRKIDLNNFLRTGMDAFNNDTNKNQRI